MQVTMNTASAPPAAMWRSGRTSAPLPTQDAAPSPKQTQPAEPTDAMKKGKHAGKAGKPKVPGVIRLLEAGHFKGVADVRLRINFHEQLSARAAERAGAELNAGIDGLVQIVGRETDTLLASLALDEPTAAKVSGLIASFEDAMRSEAAAGGATDPEALGASLSSAFIDFTSALRELIAPSEPEQTSVKNEPGLPEDEIDPATADPVGDPLAALTSAFQAALTELMGAISRTNTLPEPSAPSGNGAAYGKFLAIYNDLRGVSEPPALDVEG
jgi:hypothetical protein